MDICPFFIPIDSRFPTGSNGREKPELVDRQWEGKNKTTENVGISVERMSFEIKDQRPLGFGKILAHAIVPACGRADGYRKRKKEKRM